MSVHRFVCVDCGQEKIHVDSFTTGYGIDKQGRKVCYSCCGKRDSTDMSATGRAVLYLTEEGPEGAVVSNWPGTLKFRVRHKRVGSHNLARRRVDVWFADSDGREWHGINYGHNSQLCHCRRLRGMTLLLRSFSALPVNSRPVTREALPAPWCCRSRSAPRSRPVVLPTCCAPGRLPTCCPWCCRPVLPTCCAAGQLPAGCPHAPGPWCYRRAALPVNSRPVAHAPGPSLGKRCRPRGAAGQRPHAPGPWCCRRAALPAGCRRAARGVAGPCYRRAALPVNSRPVAPTLPARGATDVLRSRSTPGRLPTLPARHLGNVAGPWCCRRAALPVNSRPVAPRSRPVTREALPARGAAGQDRPHAPGPWCCRHAALPAGCRRAARGVAGPCYRRAALPVNSRPVAPRFRPVTREALPARGAAGQDRPHAPGPWCCRRAALPAGCRRAGLPAPRRCRSTPGRVPRRRLSNRGRKWLET